MQNFVAFSEYMNFVKASTSLNARLTRSKIANSNNRWWNILWSFFRLNNLNEHEFPNRPTTKVVYPKYYKNWNKSCTFNVFEQIGLSGQYFNFFFFCNFDKGSCFWGWVFQVLMVKTNIRFEGQNSIPGLYSTWDI